MDSKRRKFKLNLDSVTEKFGKYKYAALLFLVGILILLLPTKPNERKTEEPANSSVQAQECMADIESSLQLLLSKVDGVGKCAVMLRLKSGMESIYQTDVTVAGSTGEAGENRTTVLLSQGSSAQKPLVVKTIYPVFAGAVIVCEGGDSAEVKLDVIRAVSSLTGLTSHNIAVVKMKD